MAERSNVNKLKVRAAELRKIAENSKTKVGRHLAEKMAVEAEHAATEAEGKTNTKH
jgi:hypothetical protein